MINGYGCYVKYLALKSHFSTDNYDYIKYCGKVSSSVSNFETRNDRYFFEKLAKKLRTDEAAEVFFVANFIHSESVWIGDLIEDESREIYNKYINHLQNIISAFEKDIKVLSDIMKQKNITFDGLLVTKEVNTPVLLQLWRQKYITIETVVIMDEILHFIPEWHTNITDCLIWPVHYRKLTKYKPFVMKYLNKKIIAKCKGVLKNNFVPL